MRGTILAASAATVLSGCAAESVWAPDEAVEKAAYRHQGPAKLTLFTMINNRSGAGAHSSLMVNGSQRVIFDPAGSFKHASIPERNDVVFGITPVVEDVYTRYHARETYHVRVQELEVPSDLAEKAMQAVIAYGAVPPAQCALSTSRIMAGLFPGQINETWRPVRLAGEFESIPGVAGQDLYEYDSDDNSKVLKEWNPDAVARVATAE